VSETAYDKIIRQFVRPVPENASLFTKFLVLEESWQLVWKLIIKELEKTLDKSLPLHIYENAGEVLDLVFSRGRNLTTDGRKIEL